MFGFLRKKQKEVQEVVDEVVDEVITKSTFHHYIKNDLKVTYPLYIGDEVIVVGNEPNSVFKGTIVSYEQITMAKNIVPIVSDGEKEYMSLGILIPFEQELYDKLMSLSSDKSAWNYVSPSWTQLSGGTKFRTKENSVYKF